MHREILLIAPKIIRARRYPSVGLGYIGSYLRSKGYEVKIVDSNFTGEDPYKILKKAMPPGVVGISCESKNVKEALEIARYAKTKGNVVVMGGMHVSLIKGKILENNYVDYGIHGDGEVPFFKFLQALEGNLSLAEVPGLIYRKGNEIIINANEQIEDLDGLPFPDYQLAGIRRIFDYPLMTSRNCPYRCSFCAVGNISNGKWRARSPENLVAELKLAKGRYDIKRFTVLDNNFSYNIGRVKEFCNELLRNLIRENFILPWGVLQGIRADRVDRELLRLFKISGCKHVVYGLESVDENIFKCISKEEGLSTVKEAIELAKNEGMKVGAFFIVGLPGSTFGTEMKSIQFFIDNKLDFATFWMAIPYYNTDLYKWVLSNATLLREPIGENLVNSIGTKPFFEMPAFPQHKILKAFLIAQVRTKSYRFDGYYEGQPLSWFRRFLYRYKNIFIYICYSFKYFRFAFFKKVYPENQKITREENHTSKKDVVRLKLAGFLRVNQTFVSKQK